MLKTSPITSTPASSKAIDRWLLAAVALAILGTALLVDPFASAAFDAPKRLAAMIGAVFAAIVFLWRAEWPDWRRWSRTAQLIVMLITMIAIALIVSTCLAAHPRSAWSALRTMTVFALLLPIGAARAWTGDAGKRVVWIVVAAILINAALSLLQAMGLSLPLPIAQLGGRYPTGALLGNEGYVALACAVLTAAAFAVALNARRYRQGAVVICVLAIAAIVVNRQLTSAIALAAAMLVVLALRWRPRWIIGTGAAVLLLAASATSMLTLGAVGGSAMPTAHTERLQQLTTYRLGAWAAATEMVRARPLHGFGPGSYALQSQPHRLSAELRLRARLTPPPTANAFTFAHHEYLQLAAEAGLPCLFAAIAALGLLIAGLVKQHITTGSLEAAVLLAVITVGAVAALAWFPLQIPLVCVLLLLALGRAWRLIADEGTAQP